MGFFAIPLKTFYPAFFKNSFSESVFGVWLFGYGFAMLSGVYVIVLAAGEGRRFKASGAREHKLNVPLAGRRLREHVLASVLDSGLPSYVVEPEHIAHLPNAGMGDSIAAGVAATVQASGWLILPADLPLVLAQTLLDVVQALRQHSLVVPCYQGQHGHPVGFGVQHRSALLQLSGDHGARALLHAHKVHRLELADEGIVLDVDTLSDLDVVQNRISSRSKA